MCIRDRGGTMPESFMDKLKRAAGNVADGAKDLAASTKLKMDIASLQGKIKDAKQELGVNVYAMLEQGNTIDNITGAFTTCLLYTSDAADDLLCVDLGGRRIIKKQKQQRVNF